MKHIVLFLLLFLSPGIWAQNLPYNFSVDHGVYTPLNNPISLNNGETWDDVEFSVDLGFNFKVLGQTTSTLKYYGNTAISVLGSLADPTPLIVSYGADLYDRGYEIDSSESPISYIVEGVPGSRICKIEWANAGFYEDFTNTDFINTQVWLYEGSNIVELHFGPSALPTDDVFSGFTGPVFGFINAYSEIQDEFDHMWYLVGPANNPVVKKIKYNDIDTLNFTINGIPGDGVIYRFDPNTVQTNDPQQFSSQIKVFPSVAREAFTIEVSKELMVQEKELQYEIIDQAGSMIQGTQLKDNTTQVRISDLPKGVYFVHLYSSDRSLATKKIVKQ